jgi:hypothetical protein
MCIVQESDDRPKRGPNIARHIRESATHQFLFGIEPIDLGLAPRPATALPELIGSQLDLLVTRNAHKD